MKCLDTDLLVAILRGSSDARKIGLELDTQEVRPATTSVNAFEIFYGANHSEKRKDNVEKARALFQKLEVVPFTLQASHKAGQILADLTSSGEIIEYRDAMIAGIVIESGMTLLTRNKKHFSRISELKIETW